jgi:hypothetical protein
LLDLNPVDFAIWLILQGKVQAMPHANLDSLRLSITMEWDWLVAKYIRKTCRSFQCQHQVVAKKN